MVGDFVVTKVSARAQSMDKLEICPDFVHTRVHIYPCRAAVATFSVIILFCVLVAAWEWVRRSFCADTRFRTHSMRPCSPARTM